MNSWSVTFSDASIQFNDDLKVSCRFGLNHSCKSQSKRDQRNPKAWVCGSNFSNNERRGCCVCFSRLERGLLQGVSGNRSFPK